MDRETLGAFIAGTRKELGTTQRDLAAALHVTDKAVSKWERGLSYPDVTLLEPLAAALGLGVEELMACQKQTERGREEEPVKNLLTISQETVRRERRRSWRRVAWALALAALAGLVIFCCAGTVTERREDPIFLKETVDGTDYLYVELRTEGHLLKLKCGPEVDFDALLTDGTVYQMDCRWDPRTHTGTVSACGPTGIMVLGGLEDAQVEPSEGQVFGVPAVLYAPEHYYKNPYGEGYLCDYRFWTDGEGGGMEDPILLVKDCLEAAPWDLDGDGANEVVVRTRWAEKPYTVYDWAGGELVKTWPDKVPDDVRSKLVCVWEQ